jgi:predicted transposase YbfD/YdcC
VALNHHLDWPGVQQVCRAQRQRTKGQTTTTETAYYISSLPRSKANARQLATLIRDHWGAIENGVHWVRDVVLDEDRCTIFRGHSPQNWAAARNAALNFLRSLKTDNFAATLRTFTRNSLRLFAMLGFVK